jgi:hypothetical protein
MADPLDIDSCCLIERNFKGEEDDHLFHQSSDQLNPFRPPGPYLRTDIVENRDSSSMGYFGQPKVEIREVD